MKGSLSAIRCCRQCWPQENRKTCPAHGTIEALRRCPGRMKTRCHFSATKFSKKLPSCDSTRICEAVLQGQIEEQDATIARLEDEVRDARSPR